MSSLKSLLEQRLGKKDPSEKMTHLAKRASEGGLSSFSGVFHLSALSDEERKIIQNIVEEYGQEKGQTGDLEKLIAITTEVKAINAQAALLHGERIKQAHSILAHYRDGAFSRWLMVTYGNRQTPYNFWQYYEFHLSLPKELQAKVERMPKQAVYTLAARKGEKQTKELIVSRYTGGAKKEILNEIRKAFPLDDEDLRSRSPLEKISTLLKDLNKEIFRKKSRLNSSDKALIEKQLQEMIHLIKESS